MDELTGHIDIATYFGVVIGSIGRWRGTRSRDWTIQLGCGDITVKDVPLARRVDGTAKGAIQRMEFSACLPCNDIDVDQEVSLFVLENGRRRMLASTKVASLAGSVDLIDNDGNVLGWAFCRGESPAIVELWIDGDCVCTMLADRYRADFSNERTAFVGFRSKVPVVVLNSLPYNSVVSLQHRQSATTLFKQPISDLRTAASCLVSGQLPIDAIVQEEFEAIYDREAIEYFYNCFGPKIFVEMAYCYLLERPSDPIGAQSFLQRLTGGSAQPRDVLSELFYSGERRQKGNFLGPFVEDPGYPFALPAGLAPSRSAEPTPVAEAAHVPAGGPNVSGVGEQSATAIAERPERLALRWGSFSISVQKRLERTARKEVLLGNRARDDRDWTGASRHYRKALDYAPADAAIWVQYGHALKEAGDFGNAESAYREALKLDPSVPDTHLQLASLLKREGKIDEAALSYLQSIALDPATSQATLDLLALGWTREEIMERLSVPSKNEASWTGEGAGEHPAPGQAAKP